MSEGGVYLSAWALEDGTYRIWLPEHPDLMASGSDFETTADELSARIGEWNGDGEAVLEFSEGRPGADHPGVLLALRVLGYNESVRGLNRAPDQFEGGICGHCQFGIGARTGVPLEVDRLPKGNVAGVDRTLPRALIVAEDFLALLDENERSRLRTQPIVGPQGRAFAELVGDPVATCVGLLGAEYPAAFHQSWQCSECRRRDFSVHHSRFPRGASFLGADGMALPPPSLFVFDEGSRLAIAVSKPRWTELAGQPGTSGFTTDDLLIVEDALAEPAPNLPSPDEFDWIL